MDREKILKKAIEKAVKNGWDNPYATSLAVLKIYTQDNGYFEIIFSHDFVKAFWGENYICHSCLRSLKEKGCTSNHHLYTVLAWAGHLQKMVFMEDPIKYLGQFIEKKKKEPFKD